MAKTKKTRGGLPPNKYLSKQQLLQLREHAKEQAALAKANHSRRAVINEAIIDVMLNTGLRAEELCQLQMQDLPHCHGKNVINVQLGKGNIQRSVPVSSALAKRINLFVKQYRKGSKPKSFLFTNERGGRLSYRSLYSRVRIIGRAAGIENLTPHKLRHTFATMYYNKWRDLFGLQDLLGHADPQTTHIYAKTSDERIHHQAENFDL